MSDHRISAVSLLVILSLMGLLGVLAVFFTPADSGDLLSASENSAAQSIQWTSAERYAIGSLSLDKLQEPADPSNKYAENKAAIAFGTQLFFDNRLSRSGNVSCAGCHKPQQYFSDGLTLAMGQDIGRRNTPSLHGVAHNDWFFWDGRKDSLWSQALAPLENPAEHNFSRTAITKLLLSDQAYLATYSKLFSKPTGITPEELPEAAHPDGNIEQIKAWKSLDEAQRQQIDQVFANIGKAIAAYVTTLRPLASRFDAYARALPDITQRNDQEGDGLLNLSEQRGLRLFIGKKANCISCHSGALFSNQSFHNIGSGGKGDSGRAAAISRTLLDRFNCLGNYSDATDKQCRELRYMQRDRHQLWGSFKTPSLRNFSNTPPYFHDGRYQTLAEVIDHYTDAETTATHLPVIELSAGEKLDLIAFLNTLAATP